MTECRFKLCAHRAIDGSVCRAPALRQADFCRHHLRAHRPAVLPAYIFEASTVHDFQLALLRTVEDIWNRNITPKLGGQILHELDKRIRVLASSGSTPR